MPSSHEGVRFEQLSNQRFSSESARHVPEEEAFALLSDSDASDSDFDDKDYAAPTRLVGDGPSLREKESGGVEARAKKHAEAEHALTPLQAIRAYPMAIFWCLAVSLTVIMEGKNCRAAKTERERDLASDISG